MIRLAGAFSSRTEGAELEEWLDARKEAGRKVDPDTAILDWKYGYELDPYGVYDEWEHPEEFHCIGRQRFARAPESDIWVEFSDLPDEVVERIWARSDARSKVPASFSVGIANEDDGGHEENGFKKVVVWNIGNESELP